MSNQLAVIFDVDGVLTDSYIPHYKSWERMFGEIGVEFNDDQFRSTFGRTNRDIFAQLYPGETMTAERTKELGDRKEELYREIIRENFTPLPGAVELIDALTAAEFKLGVGSSGPPENVRLTLEKLGRAERFGAVVTGADVTHGKPHPEVFLKAAERLGERQRSAVIEDAPQGIEAANRAGMTSIAVLGTTTREKLAHATLVVEGHHELTPGRIVELIHAR